MLTIENVHAIVNKTLDKKNFYVESITESMSTCAITGLSSNPTYNISITNRKYSLNVTLDRVASSGGYMLVGTNGKVAYLSITQIKNIDIVLDKIRYITIHSFIQ